MATLDPQTERELKAIMAIDEDWKRINSEVAQLLSSKYRFVTIQGEVYVYESGVYSPGAEELIRGWLELYLSRKVTEHSKKEVIGHIRDKFTEDMSLFDNDRNLINVRNGLYDVKAKQLRRHDPDYLSIIQYPLAFEEGAAAPEFERFLSTIQPDADIRQLLLENMAQVFRRRASRRRAVILLGEPGTGKTTLINIVAGLVGPERVSSVSLSALCGGDQFAASELVGKVLNAVDELEPVTLKATEKLKALTGGARFQRSRAIMKKGTNFTPSCEFWYATNDLPIVKEVAQNDLAFFDRFYIIPFKEEIPPETANKQFAEQVVANELPGIFNVLIPYIERGEPTFQVKAEATRDFWLNGTDGVYVFVKEFIAKGDYTVPVADVKALWTEFRVLEGFQGITSQDFNDKFETYASSRQDTTTIRGKSVKVWRGIKVKEVTEVTENLRTLLLRSSSSSSSRNEIFGNFGSFESNTEKIGSFGNVEAQPSEEEITALGPVRIVGDVGGQNLPVAPPKVAPETGATSPDHACQSDDAGGGSAGSKQRQEESPGDRPPPVPAGTCPECRKNPLEGPLHYKILKGSGHGEKGKVGVCRDCWLADQKDKSKEDFS